MKDPAGIGHEASDTRDVPPEEILDAATLFKRHAQFVARFLVRQGVKESDLDDLVQEVFLTAHRRGGFVPGPAKPTTWLAEIAVRVASTARRTKRRRPEEPDGDAVEAAVSSGSSPARAAEATESLSRVERALDQLDEEKRTVFVLFELEGEPCDAIAAALDVPVGTVYSRLHAARRKFRAAYRELGGAEVGEA